MIRMSSSFIGQPNEKGGAYAFFLMFDYYDDFTDLVSSAKIRCRVIHMLLSTSKQMNLLLSSTTE